MNIEREETGTLTATLKVTLSPEDYTPGVEKALKEQRKTAAWPGFRPGQVPMSIVRKRVGRAVLVSEVERLIGQSLNGYIQENKLRVLGQPLPLNSEQPTPNWEEPGEFQFLYELGLAPSFDVDLQGLQVEYPLVDVNAELVQREVSDMQRRFGTMSDVEAAADQDMLLGDLIELDANGAIKPGGLMNRTTISLEYIKGDDTRRSFLGKVPGDEVTVAADRIAENHDDLARMLNTDQAGVHQLAGGLLFRIAEIKRLQPVPLGQELFDRVYGQDAVTDEAGFRARVKEGLENMFRRDSDRVFKRMAMKKMQDRSSIALPDGFLKRWVMMNSEKPMSPEDMEAGYPGYADGLKRQLVEDKVIEKYGLEAKGEELDAFAKRYVADQFAQYGMPVPEGDDLQRMAARILGDRDQIKRMRDAIVEQKLTAHFKAMLSPKEQRISFDEFVNLARTA